MAGGVTIRLDTRSRRVIEELIARFDEDAIRRAVLRFFQREALRIAGFITREYLSGQRLKRRTGSLARSIVGDAQTINGLPAFRVGVLRGPALKYAGIQEYGTKSADPESPYPDIVPKKAKALAQPVGPALTPAGVPRYKSARDYPYELKFIPFRRGISRGGVSSDKSQTGIGGLYEARSLRKDASGEVDIEKAKLVYLLLGKVILQPKRFLRDGWQKSAPQFAANLLEFLVDYLEGNIAA